MENFEHSEISRELKDIYDADQQERIHKTWETEPEEFWKREAIRLDRVTKLIQQGALRDPGDYLHAAMILQHSRESQHYQLAHEFSKKAADEGYEPQEGEVNPLWLAAAAKDRYLMSLGKPQLYGTQSKKGADGKWYLYETDPAVTDEERKKWHVPTLEEQKRQIEEMNK